MLVVVVEEALAKGRKAETVIGFGRPFDLFAGFNGSLAQFSDRKRDFEQHLRVIIPSFCDRWAGQQRDGRSPEGRTSRH